MATSEPSEHSETPEPSEHSETPELSESKIVSKRAQLQFASDVAKAKRREEILAKGEKRIQQIFDLTKAEVHTNAYSLKSEYKGEKVWVKFFYDGKDKTNEFRVETQIHQHVVSALHQHTPNLPELLEVLQTDHDQEDLSNFTDEIQDQFVFDMSRLTALVMREIEGESFYRSENPKEDPTILFQILYTLWCFERVGLHHNDLHCNNIMLLHLKEPRVMRFKVGKRVIECSVKYLVKVIDFDRAAIYHPEVERNHNLDFLCSDDGELINQYNGGYHGRDTYMALNNYLRTDGSSIGLVGEWIYRNFPAVFRREFNVSIHEQPYRGMFPKLSKIIRKLVKDFPLWFQTTEQVSESVYTLPPLFRHPLPAQHGQPPRVKTLLSASDTDVLVTELRVLGYDLLSEWNHLFEQYRGVCMNSDEESILRRICLCLVDPTRSSGRTDGEDLISYQPSFSIVNKLSPVTELSKVKHKLAYGHFSPETPPTERLSKWLAMSKEEKTPFLKAVQAAIDSKRISPEEAVAMMEETIKAKEEIASVEKKESPRTPLYVRKRLEEAKAVDLPLEYLSYPEFSLEEIEQTRKYLLEQTKDVIDLSDTGLGMGNAFQASRSAVDMIAVGRLSFTKKVAIMYVLFGLLSRTLSQLCDHPRFLKTVLNKLQELKSTVDFSELISIPPLSVIPPFEKYYQTPAEDY